MYSKRLSVEESHKRSKTEVENEEIGERCERELRSTTRRDQLRIE